MRSSKSAERNSSIELFRILATFLVLIVHCNGWFVGMSASFAWENVSAFTVGQALIESFSCVCVNCFLVISGYYGIKFKYRSVWNMFVLLLSIYVPFCIIQMLYAGDFNFKQLLLSFFAFSRESYFVQCYLMLTFLSPMLNSFIEKYDKRILKYVLVFWGIEIYFECLRGNESLGFNDGYSVIHFILMYMLGRSLFLYRDKILKINKNYYWGGYLLMTAVIMVCYLIGIKAELCFSYSNPFVVAASFSLFIPFLYHTFYNKPINRIAGSTFAVYIMHVNAPLWNVVRAVDNYLLATHSYGIYLLMMIPVLLAVFGGCIAYDRLRLFVFSKYTDKLYLWMERRILKSGTII